MIRRILLALALVSMAAPALSEDVHHGADHGDHHHEAPSDGATPAPAADRPTTELHRAVVQVNGVVCSFCAHGLEKALSRLDGVDPEPYGNGILVDIESQRVTLALRPGSALDFAEVHRRIVKAGYDPVRFHLRVAGRAEAEAGVWRVAATSPAQAFLVAGAPEALAAGDVALDVHVEAERVAELAADAPVPVVFDALR